MGSFLGNIGNAVKKVGHQVGSALNNPVVKGLGTAALAATGVGLPLAAAIGAGSGALGGALRPGGGLKGAITQGGQGALLGAGGSLGGTLGRTALGAIHGAGGASGAAGAASSAAKGIIPHDADGSIDWSGLAGSVAGGAKDFLTGNGGLNALGAAQGVNAALLGKKSSDFANKAFDLQNDSYTQRAPLRALGMQRLTAPTAPNVSGIQATTGSNPFAPRPLGVR